MLVLFCGRKTGICYGYFSSKVEWIKTVSIKPFWCPHTTAPPHLRWSWRDLGLCCVDAHSLGNQDAHRPALLEARACNDSCRGTRLSAARAGASRCMLPSRKNTGVWWYIFFVTIYLVSMTNVTIFPCNVLNVTIHKNNYPFTLCFWTSNA